MKCSKCNENKATYYISHESAGGVSIGFCDTCAEEIGIFSALRRVESLMHGYGMKPDGLTMLHKSGFPIDFAEECKTCGTELREFERRFFFGCEECGLVFGSIINNYITLLGGRTDNLQSVYPGRPPLSHREKTDIQKSERKLSASISAEDYKSAKTGRANVEKLEEKRKQRMGRTGYYVKKGKDRIPSATGAERNRIIRGSGVFGADDGNWLLSSIEIRRNFSDFKFPTKSDGTMMEFVRRYVSGLLSEKPARGLKTILWEDCTPAERKAIQAAMLGRKLFPHSSLLTDTAMKRILLLNSMDHLTAISRTGGRDAAAAVDTAMEPIKGIERKAEMAFSGRFGYLTASPKYLGTGISASVLLHLPYSLFKGRTFSIPSLCASKSIKCEPLAGNNFEQHGFFRISSTVGFSRSEEEITAEVFDFAENLVQEEKKLKAELKPSETKRIANSMKKVLYHATRSYRLSYSDALRFTTFLHMGFENDVADIPAFNVDDVIPQLTSAYIMYHDGGRRYTVNICEKRRADLYADLVESWQLPAKIKSS